MKCPLLSAGFLAKEKWKDEMRVDCLREECAWWDEQSAWCGEQTKTRQLTRIGNALRDIAGRMLIGG